MQAGIMLPAGHVPSMITMTGAGFASSSPLSLGQSTMVDGQPLPHLQPQVDILQATAESNLQNIEDFDNRSGSENIEGISGDDQDGSQRTKKKRYHRHTAHQIREMEAFFQKCPHPDDKQRKELSRDLGLEPLQVKFWFQNKRTQTKNQNERQENTQLRSENERLRSENLRYKEALSNASCPNCGGPASLGEMSFDEHQLRVENAQLREEIDRISGIAAKYVGKPLGSYPLLSGGMPSRSALDNGHGGFGVPPGMGGETFGAGDLLRSVTAHTEAEKPMVVELAVAGMEELLRMTQIRDPLWIPGFDGIIEILNEDEYIQAFPRGIIGPKPAGFKTEATRETGLVIMNTENLVEILMDANRWSAVFSGIVSKATTLEVFSTGVAGNYNGALQVMTAEYHLPSPLVPPRESLFVRYCKQHAEKTWAVVDVSLDGLRPGAITRCRRRASGCLIQEMPNGLTKVIWVEHVEADDRGVHDIYKPLVNSGLAFGAKRWLATLDRQCERLTSVMANNIDLGMVASQNGWKGMLKLAERMVRSFCDGVTSSPAREWSAVSGASDSVRVTSRKSLDDPGRPPGIVLNAAISFWLPVPASRLFDFLRDQTSRNEWDILSNGGAIYEMAHIDIGRDQGNCVSLLRVNANTSSNGSNMLILQENCSDATGSYVIYAPVDLGDMKVVMSGGDPDYVKLLPSGFAVFPDGPSGMQVDINGITSGGALLTVSFQILVESQSNKLSLGSVATVNNLIKCTVDRIKTALGV